jgi:hypothetical protein
MTDGYESSLLITRRVTTPVVLAVSALALLAGPGVALVVPCERQFRTRLASWALAWMLGPKIRPPPRCRLATPGPSRACAAVAFAADAPALPSVGKPRDGPKGQTKLPVIEEAR